MRYLSRATRPKKRLPPSAPEIKSTFYSNAAMAARKPPSSPPLTAGLANAAPAVDDADAALPLAELEEEDVLLLVLLLLPVPVVSDDEPDEADVALVPVAEAPADDEVKEVTEAFPDEVPVAVALPLLLLLPVSEAVAEKETHWAEPADWAWARSPALQLLSRQPAAWAPISDCEAQAQAWFVAGVQTAAMAEVRQGVCFVYAWESVTNREDIRRECGGRGRQRKAYSTGGLAFEACLGGGEAGGSNGEENGRLHGVLDWLIDWLVGWVSNELVGLYRELGVLIRRCSYLKDVSVLALAAT